MQIKPGSLPNKVSKRKIARETAKRRLEYEAQARAIREKTARLEALRLAKEAQAMTEEQAGRRLTRRDK